MLKFIKKWYFKIYHLFKLLGIFILIIGFKENVYAEEYNTCFDNIKIGNVELTNATQNRWRIRPAIRVKQKTTYYIRFFPNNNFICPENTNCFYKEFMYWKASNNASLGSIATNNSWDNSKQVLKMTIPNWGTNYTGEVLVNPIILSDNTGYNNIQGYPFIISENENEVLYCGGIVPEEPEEGNEVYNNFLELYIDKINYLAEGFTNNPYLLAMIGIIFSYIVLELFLKILHIRGGYKK